MAMDYSIRGSCPPTAPRIVTQTPSKAQITVRFYYLYNAARQSFATTLPKNRPNEASGRLPLWFGEVTAVEDSEPS
mgnify:CR=1 FL=1